MWFSVSEGSYLSAAGSILAKLNRSITAVVSEIRGTIFSLPQIPRRKHQIFVKIYAKCLKSKVFPLFCHPPAHKLFYKKNQIFKNLVM